MRRKPVQEQSPEKLPIASCPACKWRMAVTEAQPILFTKLVNVVYACERCGKVAKRLVRGMSSPPDA